MKEHPSEDPYGQILGGRYELVERIGGRPAALVYWATYRQTGGQAPVRVFHSDEATLEGEVKRLATERSLALRSASAPGVRAGQRRPRRNNNVHLSTSRDLPRAARPRLME